MAKEISNKEIKKLDEYFRAANYLSACQLYLLDNPLLERKLKKRRPKSKYSWTLGNCSRTKLYIYTLK